MKFYIVTPTYQSLLWLQCCIRSVADQVGPGVEVHHHVQDGGSHDGTPEWLAAWQSAHANTPGYTFSYVSGQDAGMYDAINRAWDAMPEGADVTAHLNSDEQYLPAALQRVAEVLDRDPAAEIVLGTYLVLDAEERYICHRRPVQPQRWTSPTVCEVITCSCFYRAASFKSLQLRFDTQWRCLADLFFYRKLVMAQPRFAVCPELYTSTFVVTGHNLAWSEMNRKEVMRYYATLSPWVRRCHALAYRWTNLRRLLTDLRCASPQEYSIYPMQEELRRSRYITHPTCLWRCRTQGREEV